MKDEVELGKKMKEKRGRQRSIGEEIEEVEREKKEVILGHEEEDVE